MNNTIFQEVEIGGRTIRFETGLLARQAQGSVVVQMGDTILLSAITVAPEPREGVDFFPLQVEYREKFYAAGKFPGGYFKREAKPTEKEILTARATDRPIRPLFPEYFRNDVLIMNDLLCVDGDNEPDVLSINAASAALHISDTPFMGPIGAVRVSRIAGKFIVNPSHAEIEQSDLNLLYVGGAKLPIMIEGSAKEISEQDLVAAMKFAHAFVVQLIEAQVELRRKLGLADKVINSGLMPADEELRQKVLLLADSTKYDLAKVLLIADKKDREVKVKEISKNILAELQVSLPELSAEKFADMFDHVEIYLVRRNVLENHRRIDGRSFDELRPLAAQIGLLPRTHGSSLFSRGETQALATVTLGTTSDAQGMDAISGGPDEKRFMLHYNFPPYSTGEVRRVGVTSRREIGHGNLAERSLAMMMPQDYPYTVRVVSEIMGSNGSSSMASVCAGTLALMDAGIPIVKPVAGISIGLFTGEGKAELVTDILGAEDHCGDMDFKVSGTRDGVTGFQVDLKIMGLEWRLVEEAFAKAKVARMQLLDFMHGVIAAPRENLSAFAPRIHQMRIDPEKIGALIGPGGKNIRRITESTGVQIDIEDDGKVNIFSTDKKALDAAIYEVEAVTGEIEVGKIYTGRVTGIKEFGAFVEVMPGKDGLVHISQLADCRVNKVEDVCKVGDTMVVKCIGVDDRGKVKLSRKEALSEEHGGDVD